MPLEEIVFGSKPEWLAKADDWLAKASRKGGNFLVSAFGNRVTLAARVAGVAAIGTMGYGFDTDNPLLAVAGMGSFWLSFYTQCYTDCGTTTPKYYHRVCEHIEDNDGKLDLQFARTFIRKTENRKYTGYCQQQGLYLAAKRYGQLDVFHEAKKTSNIVIPFF